MRRRQKQFKGFDVEVKAFTIHDKDSMFRVKRPDVHYVQIVLIKASSLRTVVREWVFEENAKAEAHYKYLLEHLA